MLMTARRFLVAVGVGVTALGIPVRASADVGAGVGASPVVFTSLAHPGGTYRLPSLFVENTGTLASTYRLAVQQLGPATGRPIPATWVRFAWNDFPLGAKQAASVPMTLAVPDGTHSGEYRSDLVVSTVALASPSGGAVLVAPAPTSLL